MIEAVVHSERIQEREGSAPSRRLVRSCVGCGERVDLLGAGRVDLLPLVFGPDGVVLVDAPEGSVGRGAHLHARPACVERAVKGGLARSARGKIATVTHEGSSEPLSAAALARAIQRSMARRMEGLLGTAARSRQLVHGIDAVADACSRGEAALVIVACDAGAATEATSVRGAVSEGRAVAWGSQALLGDLIAKISQRPRATVPGNGSEAEAPPVAVVAITSRQLAEAMRHTAQIADACTATACGSPPKGGGRPRAGTGPLRPEGVRPPTGTPGKRRGPRHDRAFPSAAAGHAKNHRSDG
jgi:predicted RNA-binding protein YlxR (DUF448 family)